MQREELSKKIFGAVLRELLPEDGVEKDVFKGMHQHMAIAHLATSLLGHATEDADEAR